MKKMSFLFLWMLFATVPMSAQCSTGKVDFLDTVYASPRVFTTVYKRDTTACFSDEKYQLWLIEQGKKSKKKKGKR